MSFGDIQAYSRPSEDPADRAALLKRWAVEAGFDRAGVAPVAAPEHGAEFVAWLERGEHGGLEYLGRRLDARLDPSLLLEGARSVLCVALQYAPLAGEEEPTGDLWPRVARYARGDDYHEHMERRLDALTARIREAFPGIGARRYVDTGPVLERDLAARAGLGAVGKNTNLLHPEGGSWFLLGELFLTLELAPDDAFADLCGTCSRCLEACPTGALAGPYHLDANLCISTWTIERRGELPPQVRTLVGEWVFGCDICQEVCPLNAAPAPADHPEMRLPPQRAALDLAALLALDRDGYVATFRRSPMKRPRLDGLQRNAAVAMGNRRDGAYLPALAAALTANPSPVVRGHAAWALGRIGGEAATAALAAALRVEAEPAVRSEILAALDAAAVASAAAAPGAPDV